VSGRAGVELTPSAVRLVRLAPFTGRVTQTVEVPWDPSRPDEAVLALRARLGSPRSISLAVGLGFIEVTRLEVPPVAPAERARIVELEPDRYFAAASREALAVTVAPDEPLAFGVPASLVESWIAAFETWAPVDWVEPSPIALARILGKQSDGVYVVEAAGGESGWLQLAHGRLTSVRRTLDKGAVNDARPIPATGSVPAQFAAALGAARWRSPGARAVPALAPDAWRRQLASRRRAIVAINVLVAVAAIVFATWTADRWRVRTLVAIEAQIAQVESRGALADTALQRLRSREMEARTIREVAMARPDPHGALAAISAALPREATVLSARASGNDWQIDGTTTDASALVPLLDRQERFDSVRFLSASSRYREANRSYETFSIAFRFRSQP
jgi:hypothetical protein